MSEEERAALHRAQLCNRRRFRQLLNRKMAGSPAAKRELDKDWEPIRKEKDER